MNKGVLWIATANVAMRLNEAFCGGSEQGWVRGNNKVISGGVKVLDNPNYFK